MPWKTLGQLAPSAKAMGVIFASALVGAGLMANFGDYSELPRDQELMWVRVNDNALAISSLQSGLARATSERAQILCLVDITVRGEVLTPLQVNERCP